ncbi:MAG: hypothetical protein WBE89_19660, partial [Methyloceanibacter sp.]
RRSLFTHYSNVPEVIALGGARQVIGAVVFERAGPVPAASGAARSRRQHPHNARREWARASLQNHGGGARARQSAQQ